MANEQFYKEAHRMADERDDWPDKAPEDWTSAELEQHAAIVYEFANLREVSGKVARAVMPKERLAEIHDIGKRARATAKMRREAFAKEAILRKAKDLGW